MKQGILTAVIAYELITIVLVGIWFARKQSRRKGQESDSFTHAGHGLPVPAVALTLALTVLGAVHVIGVFEMTAGLGTPVLWFAYAHVIMLSLICLGTGPWVYRLKIATVPQFFESAYGLETRLLVSCAMIGAIFGIITLEAQGLGVLFYTMTGWPIHFGGIVGGLLGILYVVLAGMREISFLNIINAAVMYVALILAVIFVGMVLPGGNYDTVAEFHRTAENGLSLSPIGDAGIIVAFGLPVILAVAVSQSVSQMTLQTAMSADSEKTLKRSMWIAAPVNGMFAVFAVILALTAFSMPEYAERGAKVATTDMLIDMLPSWLAALLLAAFVGVILSTFAMTTLASSTLFATDIYKRLFKQDAGEDQVTGVTRICIVIFGVLAMGVSVFMPPILDGVAWLLAWMTPVFWVMIYGLFWKRNQNAVIAGLLTAWSLNSLWSYTALPKWLGLAGVHNAYVTFISGFVVITLGILIFGGEPGLMKEKKVSG